MTLRELKKDLASVEKQLSKYQDQVKLLSRRSRQAERLSALVQSICLFVSRLVCLSVAKMQKNAIFSKTK